MCAANKFLQWTQRSWAADAKRYDANQKLKAPRYHGTESAQKTASEKDTQGAEGAPYSYYRFLWS